MSTVFLTHNKIQLALHLLRAGEGQPLLLLHGLGEQTPTVAPEWTQQWAGPVYGLDFTGHGATTVPMGGGYSPWLTWARAPSLAAGWGRTSRS